MKRILLTGTALATAAMLTASPASAEIKVSAYIDAGIGFGSSDERDNPQAAEGARPGLFRGRSCDLDQLGNPLQGQRQDRRRPGIRPQDRGGRRFQRQQRRHRRRRRRHEAATIDETVVYISGAFGRIDLGQEDNAADPEIDGQVYGVAGQAGAFDTGMARPLGFPK